MKKKVRAILKRLAVLVLLVVAARLAYSRLTWLEYEKSSPQRLINSSGGKYQMVVAMEVGPHQTMLPRYNIGGTEMGKLELQWSITLGKHVGAKGLTGTTITALVKDRYVSWEHDGPPRLTSFTARYFPVVRIAGEWNPDTHTFTSDHMIFMYFVRAPIILPE